MLIKREREKEKDKEKKKNPRNMNNFKCFGAASHLKMDNAVGVSILIILAMH